MTTQDYRTRRPLRIFLSYFKPHWKLFSLDIGCAVLIAMVDLAFPLISRKALYQWLPDKDYRVFFTVMAVVALAFVLRAGLYYIVTYWGHTFGIRVEADIRRDLFHHMQTLGFDFYDRNRTGQLMSRLTTDLFELTELAHHGPEDLVISFITIVGALAVMFAIEWRMALIVMAIIPLFLVVTQLGLINTRFVIILLGSISVYNIIVVRSFLASNIPDELLDAAIMDGCGNFNFFVKIVLPLSKAIMAVIMMYIAVSQWNSYFNSMLYLTDSSKLPLQMFLRETLLMASELGNVTEMEASDPEYVEMMRKMAQVLKYSLIVISTAPIMCIYPFVQKYFVKGVMIGSVKG